MKPEIPEEALAKAEPIVQRLHEDLSRMAERLPSGPDYAVQFRVPEKA